MRLVEIQILLLIGRNFAPACLLKQDILMREVFKLKILNNTVFAAVSERSERFLCSGTLNIRILMASCRHLENTLRMNSNDKLAISFSNLLIRFVRLCSYQ